MADPQVVSAFWDWKIGDIATWFGAVGSICAAIAAVIAAVQARKIAQLPLLAESAARAVRASIMAPAIAKELRAIQSEAERIAREVQDVYQTGHGNGRQWLMTVKFSAMPATTRYRDFIDCFPPAEAAQVLMVITELGVMENRIAWLGQIDVNNFAHDLHAQIAQRTNAVADQAQRLGELARDTAVVIAEHEVRS